MKTSERASLFIHDMPLEIQGIAMQVRDLIFSELPAAVELIKYGIPYYHLHGPLCYLHPTKDKRSKKDMLCLGFAKGARLQDAAPWLEGEQKIVRHLVFRREEDLVEEVLRKTLRVAAALNTALSRRP